MPSTPRISRAARVLALGLTAALGCLNIPAGETTAPTTPAKSEAPPTIFWPGRGPAELYKPGEVRAFVLRRGKILIGHSWGRYEGAGPGPGEHQFATRVEINLPGREPLRSAGEIVVDARGELLRGFEQSGASRLTFERREDLVILTDGRQTEELSAAPGTAYMAFSAIFHEELMLGLREIRSGELAWRLISLSGSLPVEWTATVEAVDRERPDEARIATGLGEVIVLSRGRIVSVDIEDESLQIRPVPAAWPEWEIVPPKTLSYAPGKDATFQRRAVELPGRSGEPRLAGEVLVPAAAARGPRPGVVFLAGNGQQDRHGFAGPPAVDLGSHRITDALADAGFVVLRFDERGFGESEAAPRSYALQIEDAKRALATLLVQPEVDPDRVVLVGHGESGWRALAVAGDVGHIAGVALLGAPGRRYEEVLHEQAEADIATLPPAMQKHAREEHRRLVEALRSAGELPPEFADQALWAREILAVDPGSLIARVDAPLLALQGEKDFEVDPERDPAALQALARRHKKTIKVRRYPGLDHLFKPEPGRSSPARYLDPDGPRDVDPDVLRDLAAWIDEVTGGRRPTKTRRR